MNLRSLVGLLETLAPPRYVASWDNCGLQVGSLDTQVEGVLVAVNPSWDAANFAIARKCNLLLTHHPLLFRPLAKIVTDRGIGRTLSKLLAHDVAVYSAHSNLDATACNQRIADLLGWRLEGVLDPAGRDPWYKVSAFVPISEAAEVSRAIWAAGGGATSGNGVASITFPGEGTFRAPISPGNPARLHNVAGTNLTVVVPQRQLDEVLAAVRRSHPGESPTCDVIRLENGGENWGIGLFGDLSGSTVITTIIERVQAALKPRCLRLVGDKSRGVTRVGICSGAGGDLFGQAAHHGVELFITGEIRYHAALEARDAGLAILEIGHQASEEPVVDFLVGYLRERLPATVRIEGFHEEEPFEVVS